MTGSKMSFFLVIFMLITVVTFVVQLEPEEIRSEEKHAAVQEFVKKAQEFERQNKIEKAIEIYERILIAAPEDLESRVQLATLYARTNQHDKAAQIWSQLLEDAPENLAYQDELVKSFQAAGKVNEALELAQSYIQTQPEVGVHYARLAKLYADEDNIDAAIANYVKSIELGYGDKQTYLNLARLNFFNQDIDATEIALKNAIQFTTSISEQQKVERQLISFYRYHGNLEQKLQKAEDDGTIIFKMQKILAENFRNIGELEKSVNAYEKAREIAISPNQKERMSDELRKLYIELGKIDSVVEPYDRHAYLNTNSRTYFYSLARITAVYDLDTARDTVINAFKSQDKLDVLKTHYEGKLGENKHNPGALTILARIHWIEKDYQKAAEMYETLGRAETDNVRYLYYAAAALKKNKQPELAKEVLKQAKQALASCSEKNDARFLGSLATICIKNRMYAPAIELAKSAIEINDNDEDVPIQDTLYEILARSYFETKRHEDALHIYQEMASKTSSSYTRNRAKNVIREIAKEGKLYEKWIPEQLKEVEKNPNDPNLIFELAKSYETTDKIKQAIEQYEKLTKLQPENIYWYRKLGDLFQRVDRPVDKAIEDKALSLNGNGSCVEIVDSEIINNISEQITISAWIKPTDFPNTYTPVFFKGDKRIPDISHRQFTLWVFEEGKILFNVSPGGHRQKFIWSPSKTIARNKWYHVAATINAKKDIMKLYINGYEVGRNDFKQATHLRKTTLPLRIGSSHEEERWDHASFVGQIDEVRVWKIARTEQQIRVDMNRQLKGDEKGLIGYWKFDEETDGRISDTSAFNHHGKLIGNAKLEPSSRTVYKTMNTEQFALAKAAYEKAIALAPKSYRSYDLLAKLFIKQNLISDAEAVYRRALDIPFRQATHNSLIWAVSDLYAGDGKVHKLLAILEEIEPKMQESEIFHEILGDLYKKIGDIDNATLAYAKWVKIRQNEVDIQSAYYQRLLAEELLEKGVFPETTLKYAKRAFQDYIGTSYYYPMTLGHACVVNELYDDALKYYKYTLSIISGENSLDFFWREIAEVSKKVNDKERYSQMLAALINSIPTEYSDLAPMVSE